MSTLPTGSSFRVSTAEAICLTCCNSEAPMPGKTSLAAVKLPDATLPSRDSGGTGSAVNARRLTTTDKAVVVRSIPTPEEAGVNETQWPF
ncbi:hypothetical protein D3C86_1131020 [compost metagenome]